MKKELKEIIKTLRNVESNTEREDINIKDLLLESASKLVSLANKTK